MHEICIVPSTTISTLISNNDEYLISLTMQAINSIVGLQAKFGILE